MSETWRELSYDMKLMFAHHAAMLVLFMAGGSFSIRSELLIWILLVSVLGSLSVRHRRQVNWKWPGASVANYFQAAGFLVLGTLFLGAGSSLFPPTDPRALPWYLGGLGIILGGAASALRIITGSEAEFVAPAADSAEGRAAGERPWKRWIRAVYVVCFLIVWLAGIASLHVFSTSYLHGSPSRTSTMTEPLYNHGSVRYVAPSDKARFDRLQAVAMIGVPALLIIGLALHYGLQVDIYPRKPKRDDARDAG